MVSQTSKSSNPLNIYQLNGCYLTPVYCLLKRYPCTARRLYVSLMCFWTASIFEFSVIISVSYEFEAGLWIVKNRVFSFVGIISAKNTF